MTIGDNTALLGIGTPHKALEAALDSDDVEAIERAVQPVLDALGQDVHGPLGDIVKALGRHARRMRIRANAAEWTTPSKAYDDAARIVLEPREGVAPYLALMMAERMKARAQGLGEPGAGAFPHERAFRVYRNVTGHAGIAAEAVQSMNTVGRGGLLTLEEARKVRDAHPGTWIGQMPPVSAPRSPIMRVEG